MNFSWLFVVAASIGVICYPLAAYKGSHKIFFTGVTLLTIGFIGMFYMAFTTAI